MKKDKRTLEQMGGFVTIHVALPPRLLKWVVKRAKHEGHRDVSLVVRRGVDCLMARHKAGSPLV